MSKSTEPSACQSGKHKFMPKKQQEVASSGVIIRNVSEIYCENCSQTVFLPEAPAPEITLVRPQ